MATRFASLSDWLLSIFSPAQAEHDAALSCLISMLAGDISQRTPPRPSLPGRPGDAVAEAIGPPAPVTASPWRPPVRWERSARPAREQAAPPGRARRYGGEPTASDADGPYAPKHLERMDLHFTAAVERAFASGEESRESAAAVSERLR